MKTLNEYPEILSKTRITVFEERTEKKWKAELEEYIAKNTKYTGDVFYYEHLMGFMDRKTIQLTAKILKTKYARRGRKRMC